MHTREEQLQAFDRLLTIMDELRVKCPWDKKQTFESLRQNTVEEANELAAAIIRKDMNEISKEVGDVLLHVVFYAKMGSETGDFDMADVCNRLCDKLIFRHPHVYGEVAAQNAEEVSHLWEQVKLKEKGGNKTVLGGIPDSLPSLIKAYRIQDKVANVGFDWEKKEMHEGESIVLFNGLDGDYNIEYRIMHGKLYSEAATIYDKIMSDVKPEIIIDEHNAKYVKRAFELYATGMYSYKTLGDKLYLEGFRHPKTGEKYPARKFEWMLHNIFYIGKFKWGGEIYEGNWVDNMHNGQGTYKFANGTCYVGEWKNHKMNGTGKFIYLNQILVFIS